MKLKNNLSIDLQMRPYIEKGFTPAQIIQIRKGLESNVDVSKYTHIRYIPAVMHLLRELMTVDDDFDLDKYVIDDKLEIMHLVSRHMRFAHPHGPLEPFTIPAQDCMLSNGPYYVSD